MWLCQWAGTISILCHVIVSRWRLSVFLSCDHISVMTIILRHVICQWMGLISILCHVIMCQWVGVIFCHVIMLVGGSHTLSCYPMLLSREDVLSCDYVLLGGVGHVICYHFLTTVSESWWRQEDAGHVGCFQLWHSWRPRLSSQCVHDQT